MPFTSASFENGQDREHCRLDMHKVGEADSDVIGAADEAREAWFAKWGAKVEAFLHVGTTEQENETEELRGELGDAREATKLAVSWIADAETAISNALEFLEKEAPRRADLAEAVKILNAIGEFEEDEGIR